MSGFIRGGVPRRMKINAIEYDSADGATINYMLSGRSGAVHIAGNDEIYQESNPHLGGFNQDISVSDDKFKILSDAQSAGEKISGLFTTADNKTFRFSGGISNDGALENDNGVVSLEFRGIVEAIS